MTWLLYERHRMQQVSTFAKLILVIGMFLLAAASKLDATPEEDVKTEAALDTKCQAAVKATDATTMDQILPNDFVLVARRGKVYSKADLIDLARKKEVTYERQEQEPGTQKVRVWGNHSRSDCAPVDQVGVEGRPADYKLWLSDTHVRTPASWRYVFGRPSLPLPKAESHTKP